MHRVLVLGKRRFLREALVSMICSAPGWSASSATGEDLGTAEPADAAVDVVLLQASADDLQLEWAQRVRTQYEHAPFVVIAPGNGREAEPMAEWVGAKSCLSFSSDLEALFEALRGACSGDDSNAFAIRKVTAVPVDERSGGLTARETEIVRRLSAAQASQHIAESLGISSNTLRTHLRNIMVKLGAHSRVEIVARARQLGLLHAGAGACH